MINLSSYLYYLVIDNYWSHKSKNCSKENCEDTEDHKADSDFRFIKCHSFSLTAGTFCSYVLLSTDRRENTAESLLVTETSSLH